MELERRNALGCAYGCTSCFLAIAPCIVVVARVVAAGCKNTKLV